MNKSKYQEALDELVKTSGEFFTEKEIEAIKTLQELIDKATPKKPIKDEVQDIRYVTKYICPNCGGKFTGKISDYCYHCGQALDWSKEE